MKPSTLCLFPASLGLASVLRPDAIRPRSVVPLEEQEEPPSCVAARARLSLRAPYDDGWNDKSPFIKAIEDWFRSSSPSNGGSWPGDAVSPIHPGDYGHSKGVPQWGGQEPPISDEDFCTIVRSMGWIARNIIPDTKKMRPEMDGGIGEGVCNQKGEVVVVLRMMMTWQKLLTALKRQLDWTGELTTQVHCALCYREYSIEAADWLVALRAQADKFTKSHPLRQVVFQRLDELHDAHHEVARLLHDRRSASLIDKKIPYDDQSGLADLIYRLYGKQPGNEMRRWIQEGDPAYPRTEGGLFKQAKNAWAYQKDEEEHNKRALSAEEGAEPDNEELVKRDTPTETDSLLEAGRVGGLEHLNGSWPNGTLPPNCTMTGRLDVVPLPTVNTDTPRSFTGNDHGYNPEDGGCDQKTRRRLGDKEKQKEKERVNLQDGKCRIRKCGFRERLACHAMRWDYCVCGPGCTQKDVDKLLEGHLENDHEKGKG